MINNFRKDIKRLEINLTILFMRNCQRIWILTGANRIVYLKD